MTAYSLLPRELRYLLVGLLFVAAMGALALCLYEHLCRCKRLRRFADGALFLALLCLCAYLTAAARRDAFFAPLPWLAVVIAAVLSFVRAAFGMRRTYRESRERLTPSSVKQALDDLNAGILFADGAGRAILVNHTMGRLAGTLLGSFPQTRGELEDALCDPPAMSGVRKLDDAPALYRFPDGRVWRIRTLPLAEPSLAHFTQTTAQDMTALYETNAQLAQENEALRVAIEKMRRMAERMADVVREQEALNLKIRVHNEIGAGLIALSELVSGGRQEDADEQLRLLEHALMYFGSEHPAETDTFEAAQRQAAEMNVSLRFDGYLPPDRAMESLIASAARECVTNCVRHAGGRSVDVKTVSRGGVWTVTITNDGTPPSAPVVEGGGLSSLRRNVESAGGEMRIDHTPRFALELTLPERRPET